ncbi:FecR domain-containing protein [Dysgonomonas sp. Marseille-P4677]|uniref:FecR family protein n=1 Tax=Dysgonomonas sp. Marseille-P4677 TaxID=2364790 RepID=UPI0019138FF1|nr:FecR domain-containing protein [Dysgonomonas sp. Marseille-P4677]MBK5722510.1 FecR domain-containing protein [Dysgonomonas sp. Marseille-P4677]
MIEINDNIEAIIFKVFSKEASAEEIEKVHLWVKENDEHKKVFMHLKNIWDVADPPFSPEDIDTEKAYANIITQIDFTQADNKLNTHKSLLYYWQQIAAFIALPLLLLSVYFYFTRTEKKTYATVYQEIFAPYGTRSVVNLPDSSKVWLNAGSSIKYPVHFDGGERHISLNGEAYFEVKSDKENPFIVHTKKMEVRATGTAFNVEAYKKDSMTAITLVEGIVDVKVDNKSALLKPGEKMDYNHAINNYSINITDTYKWCSWKDGILAFRNDPLEYVFKRLGQMYNINFVIKDNSLKQYIYHATFEGESLDEILHLLEVSAPIRYKKLEDRKDSFNYYHKQTIVVYKSK